MELPRHIAIIMDGNGRWAQERALPRMMGHQAGRRALKAIVKACAEKKIDILTVYAFSTENWNRPKLEVEGLMRLLRIALETEIEEMHENNVKFKVIGEVSGLSQGLQKNITQAEFLTKNNTGLMFNMALNYGARREIVHAAQVLAKKVQSGELDPTEITEALFEDHLWLKNVPDPDLLIRTSGEHRVSNFLLWQCAYTEFYFPKVHFPDFDRAALDLALQVFAKRERRYGYVSADAAEEGHCA